jgi:hypothetical protein
VLRIREVHRWSPVVNELFRSPFKDYGRWVSVDIFLELHKSRCVRFTHAETRPYSPGYFQELSSLSIIVLCALLLEIFDVILLVVVCLSCLVVLSLFV